MDPKNELTYAELIPNRSQTNNVGGDGVDIQDYIGKLAVIVHAGAPTAGDAADRNLSVRLMSASTNNVSNASNISGAVSTNITNSASLQTIQVDTRVADQYLFAVPTITGTNSPAYPLSVSLAGSKVLQ